ncbi:cyclic peptide export ABC transporter [Leptolyngbya sp. FACHB-261]|uniref:cyclic peptide export ABC transporter n=1 Tax=Leptolyngbya sp. FACHB-261 TaxID=2692806 RepID=UPI001686E47D|nr:cyclic peptide export ABC transporter [Leptolyngbya sp. FACHB-261]MBD2099951.1 cyclic peptide export ABC transporter [Leptolyngbya sp. FACHB-261]
MNLIRLLLSTSGSSVLLATFTGLLSGASSAGIIALINTALQGTSLPRAVLALSFLGLCLLMLISTAISQMCIGRVAEKIISDLRLLLTSRILACPLRHIEEIGIPRLLAALTQDIEVIANASIPISLLCVFVALLLGSFVYLSWLSLPLFVLTLVLMPLGIVSNQYLIYRGRHSLKSAREEQDNLFKHFRTATEGIKELKLNQQRRQAFLTEDLRTTAEKAREYRITATDLFAVGGSWGLVALFVLIGVILFVSPLLFTVPSSVLSGYVFTLLFMLTPIRGLLNTIPELLRANIALEKINSLGLSLAAQTNELEQVAKISNQSSWQSLQCRGISHAYRGEREDSNFTLGPLDLTLCPGEIVFIVGGNGSGKSTLVKLLTGLYVPEAGTIEFDGQRITNDNRDWYRQQFSVVFSDFYLFNRLLGFEDFNCDRQAQVYLEQLHLDHKVKVSNGTFSTTALSQGQRKRLALLTAYLEGREIFVFDEWASDQDPAFKKVFYTQLLPDLKQQGKAVVVISHDDHYFDQADRILKLDYGKVEYDRRLHP